MARNAIRGMGPPPPRPLPLRLPRHGGVPMTNPCPSKALIGGKLYGCRLLGNGHKGGCEYNRPIHRITAATDAEPLTGVI